MAGASPALRIEDVPERERYELTVDDRLAGMITYRLGRGRITFVHAEIDDAFEGRGLGSRLARAVLDDARARGLAVRPACPFVAEYIDQHPEYADLVDRG
jgi:predicted GNAT family acetyltransferase